MNRNDYVFKVIGVHKSYPTQAMRRAALEPLCTAETLKQYDVTEMLSEVQSQWRGRLDALHLASWTRLGGKNLQYARNCPPFGVNTNVASKRCMLRTCPFCWARDVVATCWDRVFKATFKSPQSKATKSSLEILAFVYEEAFDGDASGLRECVNVIASDRLKEVHQLQPHGAYISQTIRPMEDKRYVLRRAGICLIKDGAKLSKRAGLTPCKWARLDRAGLVKIVSKTCKYPVEMMRCDPKQAITVMKALQGIRMVTTSGAMYGRK